MDWEYEALRCMNPEEALKALKKIDEQSKKKKNTMVKREDVMVTLVNYLLEHDLYRNNEMSLEDVGILHSIQEERKKENSLVLRFFKRVPIVDEENENNTHGFVGVTLNFYINTNNTMNYSISYNGVGSVSMDIVTEHTLLIQTALDFLKGIKKPLVDFINSRRL